MGIHNNKNTLKAEFAIQSVEGRIKGLAARLADLAPHPDRPNHCAPLFISLASQFQPAAEYDGMAGSMILEGIIGAAFNEAANDNTALSAAAYATVNHSDMAAEALSEYLQYREESKRGQGTHARYAENKKHDTLSNKEELLQKYYSDMDERMDIEETIADLARELSVYQYQAACPAPMMV